MQEEKPNIMVEMKNNIGKPTAVLFSFDTTGSMSPCINDVRQKIHDLVESMTQDIPGLKISLIAHGDYCDGDNVINVLDYYAIKRQYENGANTPMPTQPSLNPQHNFHKYIKTLSAIMEDLQQSNDSIQVALGSLALVKKLLKHTNGDMNLLEDFLHLFAAMQHNLTTPAQAPTQPEEQPTDGVPAPQNP